MPARMQDLMYVCQLAEKACAENPDTDPGTVWYLTFKQEMPVVALVMPIEVDPRGRPERIPRFYKWMLEWVKSS